VQVSGHSNALPYNIGVENTSSRVRDDDLAAMCAAVQKQVNQDVTPEWHVAASVQLFPAGRIPLGYWPITVSDGIDAPGAAGYHDDDHRQPYAKVDATAGDISSTLSHEIIEMIVDPFGSRLWVYHTPSGDRVRVLIEACDPPEAKDYLVDGIPVSDFVLPAYYRHHKQHVQLTHLNVEMQPTPAGLQLAPGGYVSWVDGNGHWSQATWFRGSAPSTRQLGRLDTANGARSPRSLIDELTEKFRAEELA
jgi:hypothetical protein